METQMNGPENVLLTIAGASFVAFAMLVHAQQAPVQPSTTQTEVSREQQDVLQALVRELLPSDYGLDICHEPDPYRWRSAGKFTGVTFFLKGDDTFDKREGKKRPHVYITLMPKDYDGKPMDNSEDQKIQFFKFPAKFLGFRGELRAYACRDFGYGLPESGVLSEGNIRKVLGIHEDTEKSSQPRRP